MKRSLRLRSWARAEAVFALLGFALAAAAAAWAAFFWLHGQRPCGALLAAVAVVALRFGTWHAGEWRRLRGLAAAEEQWQTRYIL